MKNKIISHMNTYKIYISSVWSCLQKLFKSSGEGFLLLGKVLVVVVLVVGYGESRGQELKEEREIRDKEKNHESQVMLGFRVPDDFWTHEFTILENGAYKKETLMKYRGKPLILDFWATWCTSCMANFPKLDHFREVYGNNMSFLLVNSYDTDTSKVAGVFEEGNVKIPSIVLDGFLKQLFPHQAVPIYVWIDDFGRLGAISTSDFVNDNQIRVLLNRMKGERR